MHRSSSLRASPYRHGLTILPNPPAFVIATIERRLRTLSPVAIPLPAPDKLNEGGKIMADSAAGGLAKVDRFGRIPVSSSVPSAPSPQADSWGNPEARS